MANFIAARNSHPNSLPECWGHRGVRSAQLLRHRLSYQHSLQASAAWPENTLASFQGAIRDGAHAIESGE